MRCLPALLMACAITLGPFATHAAARNKEVERLNRSAQVFREILNAPDQSVPRDLVERCHCVVIIPSMLKGGFVVGARYGKGVVSCRKEGGLDPWGPPSLVILGGGSFGLQIGGAAVDVLMLVMNPSGIEKLLQDKFTLGGDISAAAGPVGRAATAETDAQMNAKILTYSRSRGAFAGLELKGAVLMQDREGNRNLYGRDVEARQLLVEDNVAAPSPARRLINQLTQASPQRTRKPL